MATEVYVPKMSDHMDEAMVIAWLVSEGDAVEKGQPILEVETDKAVAEIEAPVGGYLKTIRPGVVEGAAVPVGETIAFIVASLTEDVPDLGPLETLSAVPGDTQNAPSTQSFDPSRGEGDPALPTRATPAARKAARELGIEVGLVVGSGPHGRVSESDVRAYSSPDLSSGGVEHEIDANWIDLTAVQRVTARRMTESVTTAPQFAVTRHLVIESPVAAGQERSSGGFSITVRLIAAVASALSRHPRVNGAYHGGRIRINKEINVGVAVGTDQGLFVPVIRRADVLALADIDTELLRLRGLAARQRLIASDLEGGTFTISNLGMFEIDQFRAIVNPPQAAILATGRVHGFPSISHEGTVEVRDRLTATLTADHRVLDGIAAAEFLATVAAKMGASGVGMGT